MAPTTKSKRVAKSKPSIPSVTKQDSALLATNNKSVADDEAPSKAVAESSSAGQSPVSPEQVLKASRALLKYFETNSTSEPAGKLNLLEEDGDETGAHGVFSSDQVWLVVTTKKNIANKKELKPKPVKIPHPLLNPETTSALLLVKDPQRTFKDIIIPSSPTVRRVLGLSKLRAKFKTYESLRQLRDSHDLILADERIIPTLRNTLGSSFLRSTTKIPIPVRISKSNGSPATQEAIAREVKKAVEATYIHLSQTNSTNIRVGLVKHSAAQLVENIMVLIDHMITKRNIIQSGWKGVRGVFIKSGTSASLPLYLSPVLYEENEDFTTEEQRKRQKEEVEQKKKERAERQKAKKAKQLAAKKGISSATGATEIDMVTTAQSTEQVDKKRKVDENLEKTNEAIGKGSPKNKKQKVLAVPNKNVNTAKPALEKIKAVNPKGSKDGKKNTDTAVPLLEGEATPADVATVPTSKAAPKTLTNTKENASKSLVAEKATGKTEGSQEAAKQRPASKKRKEPNGDSKVETAKEEPKRRSKRVGTAGKV